MAVDDSYTKALLHMDGADASTTFTDESGKTWTRGGNAQIDTAQFKFGGASGLFDGSGDYIDTPDSNDFTLGSGNFTIDAWVKVAGGAGTVRSIIAQVNSLAEIASYSFALMLYTDNKYYIQVTNGISYYYAYSNSAYTDTNWHHIAGTRDGNTLKLFVDGILQTVTKDLTGITVVNSANKVAIGRLGEYNGHFWNGWIDEPRFSNGIARWTSNFTPPIAPYGSGNQVVLFA